MKRLLIAAIAVWSIGSVNAQNIKFGVKGGLNYATFSGDVKESNGLVGFAIGGFANIEINEKFSFQPELLYSAQGTGDKSTDTFGATTFTYDEKYKLNYLNVPLMFQLKAAEKFFVEAGPQIGFILSAKNDQTITRTIGSNSVTNSATNDVKGDTNAIDFGLNFGAGYEFTKNISAGLRYNLGLTNILKDSPDYKVKNSVFSIAIGYTF